MRTSLSLVFVLVLGFMPSITGCSRPGNNGNSNTGTVSVDQALATAQLYAKNGGSLAATGFIVLNRPSQEEATAVKKVVDLIAANIHGYQEGGFSGASSGVSLAIDQAFPDGHKYQPLARALSSALLLQLDILFTDHPEWQAYGAKVADIVKSFCDGASQTLSAYGARGVLSKNVPAWAGGKAKATKDPLPRDIECPDGKCPIKK